MNLPYYRSFEKMFHNDYPDIPFGLETYAFYVLVSSFFIIVYTFGFLYWIIKFYNYLKSKKKEDVIRFVLNVAMVLLFWIAILIFSPIWLIRRYRNETCATILVIVFCYLKVDIGLILISAAIIYSVASTTLPKQSHHEHK